MMIDSVIFDLDDTLYNEIEYVKSGFKAVAKLLSKHGFDKTKIYKDLNIFYGIDRKHVFDLLINRNQDIKIDRQTLINAYKYHEPDIRLKRNISQLLKRLKKDGYKIGILTDGNVIVQNMKIKQLNLTKYVDAVLISGEISDEIFKPSQILFAEIIKRLGTYPSSCIYIGDNPNKDFYITSILNIKTIRYLNKKGIYKDDGYYMDVKEDYCIHEMSGIVRLLNIIQKENKN